MYATYVPILHAGHSLRSDACRVRRTHDAPSIFLVQCTAFFIHQISVYLLVTTNEKLRKKTTSLGAPA